MMATRPVDGAGCPGLQCLLGLVLLLAMVQSVNITALIWLLVLGHTRKTKTFSDNSYRDQYT